MCQRLSACTKAIFVIHSILLRLFTPVFDRKPSRSKWRVDVNRSSASYMHHTCIYTYIFGGGLFLLKCIDWITVKNLSSCTLKKIICTDVCHVTYTPTSPSFVWHLWMSICLLQEEAGTVKVTMIWKGHKTGDSFTACTPYSHDPNTEIWAS